MDVGGRLRAGGNPRGGVNRSLAMLMMVDVIVQRLNRTSMTRCFSSFCEGTFYESQVVRWVEESKYPFM